MSIEIVTKEEMKRFEQRTNRKIREIRNNVAWMPMPGSPWLMTAAQLGKKLNISKRMVRLLIDEGKLTPVTLSDKPRAKIFFRVRDVMNLIGIEDELPLQPNRTEQLDGEVLGGPV